MRRHSRARRRYLGIYVSLLVFRRAEQVSRRLQQRGIMLKDAMDAVSDLREYYVQLRTDESWEEIWKHVISKSEDLIWKHHSSQELDDRPEN